MVVPWSVIDHPNGCPTTSTRMTSGTPGAVYRANFYRINELSSVSKCSSSTYEYMAW